MVGHSGPLTHGTCSLLRRLLAGSRVDIDQGAARPMAADQPHVASPVVGESRNTVRGAASVAVEEWAGARLRLVLLPAFDLTFDRVTVSVSAGAQRVLAFLAVNDRPVGRMHVAGVLWPETSDKRANGSLRSALWDLRRAGHDLVETTGVCLRLTPNVHVDYRSAIAIAEAFADEQRPRSDGVLERDLFRADLLTDWYDDWLLFERERFRQLRLHLLESLCETFIHDGRFARAIEAGIAAVTGEPLRESAQRVLIRAHLAEGNRGEALRQYESYDTLLRAELGISPSPELRALVGPPMSVAATPV